MSQSQKRYPTVFTFNIKLTSDGYDLTVKPLIDINWNAFAASNTNCTFIDVDRFMHVMLSDLGRKSINK